MYNPHLLRTGGTLTAEEAEQTKALLQLGGYELLVPIPRQIPRMSLLYVARQPLGDALWAALFLRDTVPGRKLDSGNMLFQKDGETVEILPDGQLIYRNSKPPAAVSGTEDGRLTAERFLKDKDLWQDDVKFDMAIREQKGFCYRYLLTYQGLPLFSSTMELHVSEGHVYEARVYRAVPLGFSNREVQVISAAKAIETIFQNKVDFHDRRIIDISLGYYSERYKAERWEVPPVWRIAAADGTVCYINAFTGEVEALEQKMS